MRAFCFFLFVLHFVRMSYFVVMQFPHDHHSLPPPGRPAIAPSASVLLPWRPQAPCLQQVTKVCATGRAGERQSSPLLPPAPLPAPSSGTSNNPCLTATILAGLSARRRTHCLKPSWPGTLPLCNHRGRAGCQEKRQPQELWPPGPPAHRETSTKTMLEPL